MLPLDAFDLPAETVERRFAEATRRGNPWWLWPDIERDNWRDALLRIENAAREILTGGQASSPLEGPVEAFGIAAFTSGMGPLLGCWASEGRLHGDPDILAVLNLHFRHNTIRMERMRERALEAVEALARAKIECTVLKGLQTAFGHFPHPGARPLSDLDLLIAEADLPRAAKVLGSLGYMRGRVQPTEQAWRHPSSPEQPRSLSLLHCDNPWYIDLHISLNRRPSPGSPLIELDAMVSAVSLVPWSLCPSGRALTAPALLLHLACHAGAGFENLMLLRLAELALVIRTEQSAGSIDWSAFLELGEKAGALAGAFPALHLTEQLAPGSVTSEVLEACKARAPAPVRRVVGRLRPATAQRVLRCSLEEQFMWTRPGLPMVRQLARELFPRHPLRELVERYRIRMWRLLRGQLQWGVQKGS